MKIVCASSVLHAREAFSGLGEVELLPDRDIRRDHLLDADALIVRSKTTVNAELLEDTPVSFVATATAGADHFDIPFLNSADIAWTASPGCNANAVAEYVTTALALLARKRAALLPGLTLGIVGVGQVGSRVATKAALLGLRVLRNDPPLALKTGSSDFLPLDALLSQSDILTLHTPLESSGAFPTRHLANCKLFEHLKPGAWFLNTSRGEVTDSDSLQCALDHHLLSACALDVWEHEPELPDTLRRTVDFLTPHIAGYSLEGLLNGTLQCALDHHLLSACVLDVWENEPALPAALRRAVDFLTPHIAGYSFEGLLNGTLQCRRELAHFLELESDWAPDPARLPPIPFIQIDAAHRPDEEVLAELLAAACPLPEDTRAWRAEMTADDPAELRRRFDRFRQNYTSRREFAAIRVHLTHASPALLETAAALGFQVCAHQP